MKVIKKKLNSEEVLIINNVPYGSFLYVKEKAKVKA